jgi:hypothetical protein
MRLNELAIAARRDYSAPRASSRTRKSKIAQYLFNQPRNNGTSFGFPSSKTFQRS